MIESSDLTRIAPFEFTAIALQTMSVSEIASMAIPELSFSLAEIIAGMVEAHRYLDGAKDLVADAKIKYLLADGPGRKKAKAKQTDAEHVLDHVKDRIALLKLLLSAVQSSLKIGL